MMRERQYLITYYRGLFGEPIDMRTFENRLLLQKRVYFVEEFGVPFGYTFGWYIRGPYSSDLARDGFEIESLSKIVNQKWDEMSKLIPQPNEADEDALEKTREFFSSIREVNIGESRFLEIASSLHYLKNNWSYDNYRVASRRLQEIKPRFSSEEIREAQNILQELL